MFKDQVALITGATSGIGRALALALAEQGVSLHLLGRDEARLGEVLAKTREKGVTAEGHLLDLSHDGRVKALAERLGAPLDILIHSAGVARLGELAEAALDDLDLHYRVNLRAPYLLTQVFLPQLQEAKGQIVFINSGAGLRANPGWSQYAASKHALKAVADSLRAELDGVRVISVYPGRTATPMQAQVHEAEGRTYEPENFVQPEDIAAQVVSALELPRRAGVTDLSIRPAS